MKVLLTGANGYIGKRLMIALLQQGHYVVATVRDRRRMDESLLQHFEGRYEIAEADLLNPEDYRRLPEDAEIAYYLVHSLTQSPGSFSTLEQQMAEHFRDYANGSRLQQIIYLSGIANDEELSSHLSSRFATEGILKESRVPVTVLRAAIIIGSGSASFEIIRDLVEKLPFMIAPRWLSTRCQPIAIRSVLEYLTGVMGDERTYGENYDIGGPEVLTYKEMLHGFSKARGLDRHILTVPVMTPRLSSYWLYFVTSTSYPLAVNLVNSMRNEVVCRDRRIDEIVEVEQISYLKSIELALGVIQQNTVISSWKDAVSSGGLDSRYSDFVQIPDKGCFKDWRSFTFDKKDYDRVRSNIWSIGGERGWYGSNWMWEVRGFVDQLFGGVGLRRGRKNQETLAAGEALDFWRVLLADHDGDRLLLFAEMKLPGEAWLEFRIEQTEDPDKMVLHQRATFRPKGVLGRAYWYSVLPFHQVVFPKMARGILKSGKDGPDKAAT